MLKSRNGVRVDLVEIEIPRDCGSSSKQRFQELSKG